MFSPCVVASFCWSALNVQLHWKRYNYFIWWVDRTHKTVLISSLARSHSLTCSCHRKTRTHSAMLTAHKPLICQFQIDSSFGFHFWNVLFRSLIAFGGISYICVAIVDLYMLNKRTHTHTETESKRMLLSKMLLRISDLSFHSLCI